MCCMEKKHMLKELRMEFDDLLWKNKPYSGLNCAFSIALMYKYRTERLFLALCVCLLGTSVGERA